MIRWLLITVFFWFFSFLSSASGTNETYFYTSHESSVYKESLYQGWASLPQTEIRTFQSVVHVFYPSALSKFINLTRSEEIQFRALVFQNYCALLYSNHPKILGFSNLQRIFPFHQFW